jgi:hypothetical protein
MQYPKGLTWNQNHLKILFFLQQGLPVGEVVKKTGLSLTLVKKINKFKDDNNIPGIVSAEMIEAAPKPVKFGEFDISAKKVATVKGVEQAPATVDAKPPHTQMKKDIPVLYTTAMDLVLQTSTIPMTNDIHISFFMALQGGYGGDLSDWISLCCRDFWLGRGRNMYAEYGNIMMGKKEVPVAKSS